MIDELFSRIWRRQEFLEAFPLPLWLEQKCHRDDNTIRISDKKLIVLTDFQRELWEALKAYQFVVVNAPTSAGKSFVLQHFLAALLS